MGYGRYDALLPTKEQWLGSVPRGWKTVRLKTLFRVQKAIAGRLGFDVLSVTQRGVKPKDITSGDGQLSMDYAKYQVVQPGDFVMNHMDLLTGFVDISPHSGVTSPDYRVFVSRAGVQIEPRFYLYIFQLCYLNKIFFPLGQGSAQVGRWRLPRQEFETFVLPLPSSEEQSQISLFLDYETSRIDGLIEKQQQLIALLKEKRQAVISHAVTKGLNPNAPLKDSGVEWLGQVPAHWAVRRLKAIAVVIDCRNKTPEYVPEGPFYVVRTTNVKNQELKIDENLLRTDHKNFEIWTQRGVPPAGSILFTREAPAGEVCLVPQIDNLCMGQRMMNFIPYDTSFTLYLFNYLLSSSLSQYIQSVSHGSTVSHLRVDQVENIPVPIPPLAEARTIARRVESLRGKLTTTMAAAQQQIELLKERRAALISAAVTGKIDVRNWKPPTHAADAKVA